MELQNGCVCCTLAEDLMASVSRLVGLSEVKGVDYDHIVVECSGIAEPRKIRELFQEADDFASPLTSRIRLDTLVTLVDATVFLSMYGSADADLASNAQLAVRPDDIDAALRRAMLNPAAATCSDRDLMLALARYDAIDPGLVFVESLTAGTIFRTDGGRLFCLGPKLRSRYRCIEQPTGREYRMHPLCRVSPVGE
jgi:hypothetical protein